MKWVLDSKGAEEDLQPTLQELSVSSYVQVSSIYQLTPCDTWYGGSCTLCLETLQNVPAY